MNDFDQRAALRQRIEQFAHTLMMDPQWAAAARERVRAGFRRTNEDEKRAGKPTTAFGAADTEHQIGRMAAYSAMHRIDGLDAAMARIEAARFGEAAAAEAGSR